MSVFLDLILHYIVVSELNIRSVDLSRPWPIPASCVKKKWLKGMRVCDERIFKYTHVQDIETYICQFLSTNVLVSIFVCSTRDVVGVEKEGWVIEHAR